MTPEQLQELEEKAKLWDSLGKSLYDMYGPPTNGTITIQNLSNASTFIDVLKEANKEIDSAYIEMLQEEFGEHLCSCNLKKCECLTQNNN